MSIIHDALKKVEKSITPNQTLPPIREKSGHKFKMSYYLIAALVMAAAGVFFFKEQAGQPLSASRTNTPTSPFKDPRLQPEEKKAATPAAETAPSEKPDAPSLILNGVFFSEGQGYALINNQILKENDLINRARVTRIGMEEVELQLGDETITLSTKNK